MRKIPDALAPSALATALLLCPTGHAAASQDLTASTGALKRLSIEELMDIEVTSVSRTAETLSSAAAAISVVTNEDIRRSGATTIPEALRGVPGLHVARRNSNSWAVSSRGFSSINSEKLLVLSDYAQHLHAALLRRRLGRAGLPAAGHRAHRGDSRSRREPVGLERGQRRDQHHHQAARATRRARYVERDGRHRRAAARPRATAGSSASRASFACSASTPIATRRFHPNATTLG